MRDLKLVDLFLLRHGIAEDCKENDDDYNRSLTKKGRFITENVLKNLVANGLYVDLILSSPLPRALQTTEIAIKTGFSDVFKIDYRLKIGEDIEQLSKQLKGRICLIGHQPSLGKLGCSLLKIPNGKLIIKKSGIAHLRMKRDVWELRALLHPRVINHYSV